jgi:hypothetical protein
MSKNRQTQVVNQICNGQIVMDLDEPMSSAEQKLFLGRFGDLSSKSTPYIVTVNGHELHIYSKAVTHLGKPHPPQKKRIQIPSDWKDGLSDDRARLVGIYRYGTTESLVLFRRSDYVNNRLNNSSAHVNILDLQQASENGYHRRTDSKNNLIQVVNATSVSDVKSLLVDESLPMADSPLKDIEAFAQSLPRRWFGSTCIAEMIQGDFPNKYQAEWAGFYGEFRLQQFLQSSVVSNMQYVQRKSNSELDFDIQFPNFLGDLKCHTIGSGSIICNDLNAVCKAVEVHGKLWFVIINHKTEMDSNHGYEVSKFWESVRRRGNAESGYRKRMKHSVYPESMSVLEVNTSNIEDLLEPFIQGRNSDGKERNPKFQIKKRFIDMISIARFDLSQMTI